jgi:hypothetical protein
MANFLLVTGMALACVPYVRPGQLADAARSDIWDIGLIGAEFLCDFDGGAKRSGLVARLIERHGVSGRLSPAPSA